MEGDVEGPEGEVQWWEVGFDNGGGGVKGKSQKEGGVAFVVDV